MGQSISQKKPLILPDLSVFYPFLILVTKTGVGLGWTCLPFVLFYKDMSIPAGQ